jgi:hypothetical protein
MSMRSFRRAISRLRFKRHNRTAKKADACHPSHIKVCHPDNFASKSGQCSPERGWHLLAHIGYTGTTAKIDQTHDIELNEELLERIDFLACLFAGRRINK